MNINLYHAILEARFQLHDSEIVLHDGQEYVKRGFLVDRKSGKMIPVSDYIIRFVEDHNYTDSFGYQWSTFRNLQHDSRNGKHLSRRRMLENTKWKESDLKGKLVLELGCGNGRFTEIFKDIGAITIAVDMSGAIDVNRDNLGLHPNVLYIQDDITKLYYMKGRADYVFCYGVLQHTPNPRLTLHRIHQYAVQKGHISIDVYEKVSKPSPFYGPKYFWRPITKRMAHKKLLHILKWYIPHYIKFDTFVRRLVIGNCPIGEYILGIIPIPCWNYLDCGYTDEERVQHAIMDTFDALSPMYDRPCSEAEFNQWGKMEEFAEFEVFHGSNGLVMNALS